MSNYIPEWYYKKIGCDSVQSIYHHDAIRGLFISENLVQGSWHRHHAHGRVRFDRVRPSFKKIRDEKDKDYLLISLFASRKSTKPFAEYEVYPLSYGAVLNLKDAFERGR